MIPITLNSGSIYYDDGAKESLNAPAEIEEGVDGGSGSLGAFSLFFLMLIGFARKSLGNTRKETLK